MILVITYTVEARQALRNACRAHEDTVVRRFGRAALFEATEYGAFLALRLRAAHGGAVQVERTRPFDAATAVPDEVRRAATAYADRDGASIPYAKFAAGTDHPDQAEMKGREL